MPKPLPDYIPVEIRDQIISGGYTGVMEYSEHLGLKPARLLGVFGGNAGKLRPYVNFADFVGITLDELAGKMLSGQLGTFIEETARRHGVSVSKLERLANVSDGFLEKKIKSGIYTNGLQGYIEVAHALGWSLEKLAKSCLR